MVYPYGGSETPLYANSSDYVNWENTGFIQWTPIRDTGAKSIHITARSHATQRPTPLDNLVLHARANTAYGTMLVDPPQAPAAGHTLRVTKGGADVTGNSRVDGTLLISSATTVQSGGIHVTGNSDISGQVDINGAVNIANGNVTLTSGNHQTLQGGALTVQGTGGDSVVIDNDSAVFNNGAGATTHITGPGVIDGLNVLNGGVHVQGNSDVNGALSLATGPLTLVGGANAVLQGGSVTVQADGGAQSTFSGTTLNLTAGDQSATLTAQGLVAANLTTNGTSSITGTATFDNGALQTSTASGETVIPAGKKLRIDGELVGTGDIAIGIDGDSCETVTSTLTTSGDDAECQVALADQAVFPIQCPDTSINCTQQNSCYNPDYYNGPFATWYAFTSSMCSAYGWVHPYFCDGTLFTTDPAVSLNLLKAVNNGSWPGFSMNSSYGPGTTIPAYVEECVDLLFTEFCTDVPNPSYDAAMGTLYSNWPGMVSGANPFYSNSSLHIPTCAACATSLTDFTNMLVVPQVSDGQSMAACTNGSPSTLTGSCSCQAQAAAAGVPPWTPGYCPSCVRIYEYSCGCKADASQCTAFLADTTVQSGADSNLSQGGTQCSDMTSTGCLNYVAASSYMTRCRGTECRMCEPGTMLASSLGGEMKCCKAELYLSAE